MRIAPHVIHHHADADFSTLAKDVIQDAATTHGHPRALVGALVHAQALWLSMSQPAPLAYGWLVEALLDGAKEWQIPYWQHLPETWQSRAEVNFEQPTSKLWQATCREVEELLLLARKELKGGAVSAPTLFLDAQGLTGKARGSGTLCAVAAAYLAARTAASPEQALMSAAHLKGADTDTLASMTGSLLGAALGQEWLGSNGRNVQDMPFLAKMAEDLLDPVMHKKMSPPSWGDVQQKLGRFNDQLAIAKPGSSLNLPDMRTALVEADYEVQAGQWMGRQTLLRTDDGQRLHLLHSVNRISSPLRTNLDASELDRTGAAPSTHVLGSYLAVTDSLRVRRILEDVFSLRSDRYGQHWAAYGNIIISDGPEQAPLADMGPPRVQLRLSSRQAQEIWRVAKSRNLPGQIIHPGRHYVIDVDPWLTVVLMDPGD
jgi:hypothetical protein